MYKIIPTGRFKKSLRKMEKSGQRDINKIKEVIKVIASGKTLNNKFNDHKLHGELSKLRECHIKSDLLLTYEKDEKNLILVLADIGKHDDLFQ